MFVPTTHSRPQPPPFPCSRAEHPASYLLFETIFSFPVGVLFTSSLAAKREIRSSGSLIIVLSLKTHIYVCMYVCTHVQIHAFYFPGSIANHWGNRKQTKITCPKKLQRYRIQLLILTPDSCSDSNWVQPKAFKIGLLLLNRRLCKTQPFFSVFLNCSLHFRGFNFTMVRLFKQ